MNYSLKITCLRNYPRPEDEGDYPEDFDHDIIEPYIIHYIPPLQDPVHEEIRNIEHSSFSSFEGFLKQIKYDVKNLRSQGYNVSVLFNGKTYSIESMKEKQKTKKRRDKMLEETLESLFKEEAS